MSTSLTRPEEILADLERPSLYDRIDAKKLAMIKSRMPGLDDIEVAAALELAASQGLNPWNNELFAAKGDGGRILVMVGRDGLLRKAEEFPDYTGYDAAVVYEGDHFERVDPDPDGKTLRARAGVVHRQKAAPGAKAKIIGSWCVAERRGRPPRYFFARYEEYAAGKNQYTPWRSMMKEGASGSSVMIEKVSISVAHRTLTNLSGVYLPEEVMHAVGGRSRDGGEEGDRVVTEDVAIAEIIAELDAPADLRADLLDAIERLNRLSPNAWGAGRAQLTLPGRDVEGLRGELEHVRRQIAEAEARAAAEPEPEDLEPEDAVVVEEAPAPGDVMEAAGEARAGNEGPREALRDADDPEDDPEGDPSSLCPLCGEPLGAHSEEQLTECNTAMDAAIEAEEYR